MTLDLMFAAFSAHRRFGISYWDAAIIEAVRSLARVFRSADRRFARSTKLSWRLRHKPLQVKSVGFEEGRQQSERIGVPARVE